jgi:chromosome segregation ATPase
MKTLIIPTFLLALTFSAVAAPEEADSVETKLSESLKTVTLQLRTEQTERATLQAAQAVSEAKLKELSAKVASLTKQAASDQTASRKSIDELSERSASLDQQVAKLTETLDKWKAAYAKAVEVARALEADRAKLADENSVLKAQIRDHKASNLALFTLGNEILTRYEKYSLGEALAAREPFTGVKRARLETLVQDSRDKLADERIKPEPSKPASAKP